MSTPPSPDAPSFNGSARNGHANGQLTPLLTRDTGAAALADVSRATWARMFSAGKTPAPVRLSTGCVRWRVADLERWVVWGCPDRRTFEALIEQEQRK